MSQNPPETPPAASPIFPSPETKECPNCGALLKSGAIVCRYCKRDLYNPTAQALVGLHDWERESPPEVVVYKVRLPVSHRQWMFLCYGLSAIVGVFWLMLAIQPRHPYDVPMLRGVPTPTPVGGAATPAAVSFPRHKPLDESPPHVALNASPLSAHSAPASPVSAAPTARAPAAAPDDSGDDPSRAAAAIPHSNMLNAPELVRYFDDNLDAASDRFVHHEVTVTGRVTATGRSNDRTPFVLLKGRGETGVRCLFADAGLRLPATVTVGSEVTIKGTCDGRFLDVVLVDSSIR